MDVLNFFQCLPVFDACNFYWVHTSHPLFKDYPQVINTWDVEEALLQFEVQVVFGSDSQNVTDRRHMVLISGLCGNGYAIHVNVNRGAK